MIVTKKLCSQFIELTVKMFYQNEDRLHSWHNYLIQYFKGTPVFHLSALDRRPPLSHLSEITALAGSSACVEVGGLGLAAGA